LCDRSLVSVFFHLKSSCQQRRNIYSSSGPLGTIRHVIEEHMKHSTQKADITKKPFHPMPEDVLCTCKSYCTTYDRETRTHIGGQLINRSTAHRHRLDDNRSPALDGFANHVASSVLDDTSGLRPLRNCGVAASVSVLQRTVLPGELITIEGEVRDRISWTPTRKPLRFAVDPVPDLDFESPLASIDYIPNSGQHTLLPSDPRNIAFIENENRLYEIVGHLKYIALSSHEDLEDLLEDLIDKATAGLRRMMEHKKTEWERQRMKIQAIENGFIVVNTGWISCSDDNTMNMSDTEADAYIADGPHNSPAVIAALLTVLLMHLVFHLPRRATALLLVGMRCMLNLLNASGDADQLPGDPRTVLNRFDLDPRCTSYLQCPSCYALYPYTGTITSAPPEFETCTHQPTPTSPPCGVPLWEERRLGGKTIRAPRRKYIHQSLKEWVGRLLTRPGVEDLLREPCDKPETSVMEDIWDAPVLRRIRDVDGRPFFRGREGELRLAFSLNADGFNPLHMLEAKQSLTCTAVYMIILNFPPNLRYLFRNMYLAGVIPGPGKPSLDQINHVLSLLVQELLDFWRGVFYTITFACASGLLTKGAMIPLVCDMLAARQLSGFSSATSTWFCTFCLLAISDIENLDQSSWPCRDLGEHIKWAKRWRDCGSEAEREEVFKASGVRWSALLDLPYWNPMLFSVVDSMHLDYLGMVHSHCRKVLRINVSIEGGDGTIIKPQKPVSRPSDRDLSKWLDTIRDTTDLDMLFNKLSGGCSKNILWHICIDKNLRSAGTRKQLAKNIIGWVSATKNVVLLVSDNVFKRSRVDPDSIEPPGPPLEPPTDSDDGSIEAESSADEDLPFLRKLEETDQAFNKHRISEKGIGRLDVPTLRAMCGTRELHDNGRKEDLVGRLIRWVIVFPSLTLCYAKNASSVMSLSLIHQNRVPNQGKSLGKTFWRPCGMI
jgi:hypothetical protein